SEGVDRSGSGGEACGVESFEALSGGDELARDGFPEDGSEEDDVGGMTGLFDFGQAVAGDRDHRRRESGGSVEFANLHRRELAGGRCEVDSGSGGGDGDVGTRVDEELRRGTAAGFEDAASKG